MVTNNKKMVDFAGFFAFLFAISLAFAFTPHKANKDKSNAPLETYVWIKYDCNNNGAVQFVPGGMNYEIDSHDGTLFTACEDGPNFCAVRYNMEDTHELPAGDPNAGNRVPNGGLPTGSGNYLYCFGN